MHSFILLFINLLHIRGFPGGASGKESPCQCRVEKRHGSIPGLGRSPGEGNGNLLAPVFLPGESHGQRNLAGYSPWGRRDRTEAI